MKIRYWLIAVVPVVFAACGGDELPPPPPEFKIFAPKAEASGSPQQKTEPPRYVYQGDRVRDPFIPLTGEYVSQSTNDEIIIPNLAALNLKGIFEDGKNTVAIVNGGGITYMLKGSRLYDNRQRIVKGITGIIKKESVVLISADKTIKELKIREK
jgi:Tfp pilus assembly protein PilP